MWISRYALLASIALATSGCDAPDATATGDDEPTGTVEQGLDVACTSAEPHGGSLTGGGYDKKLGCSCRPNEIRDHFTINHGGQGSCNAIGIGWNSDNPRDCSVNVHIENAVGGGNGQCTLDVFEQPDPCQHGVCTEGAALSPSCNTTAAQVCAADSFCCTNQWDRWCVGEVRSVAHRLVCTSAPCPHPECSVGDPMPSTCSSPVAQICASDPTCCNSTWDARCVAEVASIAGQTCN